MSTAAAVLFAVANELADEAKQNMPELRFGEETVREWFEKGVYYRKTKYKGKTFISQFDFKQRKES